MKKMYASPTMATNGSAVHETLGGSTLSVGENIYKPTSAGGVGFYL